MDDHDWSLVSRVDPPAPTLTNLGEAIPPRGGRRSCAIAGQLSSQEIRAQALSEVAHVLDAAAARIREIRDRA